MKIDCGNYKINEMPTKKKIYFSIIMAILIIATVFVGGELLMRFVSPQRYMYPRYQYSQKYGLIAFKNCKMIHGCPGKWKFIYTVNKYSYRGELTEVSDSHDKENIVILGDSFSFGYGVNDGEEYPAIMDYYLNSDFNVINLSEAGWGLTQEIRRYYEFGRLYSPKVVVLQYCENDLHDNFLNRVTTIKNGRFVFHSSNNVIDWSKKWLAKSIIQKSQIYNFFRPMVQTYLNSKIVMEEKLIYLNDRINSKEIFLEQKFYNELLELFAEDLNRKGVKLIIIAYSLKSAPYIKEKIFKLKSKGVCDYYEISSWFEQITDIRSPEGHWSKEANHIIGKNLSEIIKNKYLKNAM